MSSLGQFLFHRDLAQQNRPRVRALDAEKNAAASIDPFGSLAKSLLLHPDLLRDPSPSFSSRWDLYLAQSLGFG